MFSYSVAIRTLGKAGDKYLKTLQSVNAQIIPPSNINVYIPYGYDLPKETIGIEKYYRCNKGMIAQRALQYEEIDDEWILFLDDDMYLPTDYIQRAYDLILKSGANVVTANVFPNQEASVMSKLVSATQSVFPFYSRKWGFKVMPNGRYIYNNNPKSDFMLAQTGSGNCILCRKELFLSIHFEDEIWMDKFEYALGDDQLMTYKLYYYGGKEYVFYNSGIEHLGAGRDSRKIDATHLRRSTACLFLVWHRSIYNRKHNCFPHRMIAIFCYSFSVLLKLIFSPIYFYYGIWTAPIAVLSGLLEGIKYTRTEFYRNTELF